MTDNSPFKEKIIEANIKISSTGDLITLSGLRMRVNVTKGTDAGNGVMQLLIYGLTLEMMSRLTVQGIYRNNIIISNEVMVSAGNKGEALTLVHVGVITEAFATIDQAEAVFTINSSGAIIAMLTADDATSYKGQAKVSDMMADIIKPAGLKLIDKGVKKTLDNQVLKGSVWDKITQLARAAGISYSLHNNELAIWQDDNLEDSGKTIASDGDYIMLGYPSISSSGAMVRVLFAPDIKFFEDIKMRSELKIANGTWLPQKMTHELDCYTSGGVWQTVLQMSRKA